MQTPQQTLKQLKEAGLIHKFAFWKKKPTIYFLLSLLILIRFTDKIKIHLFKICFVEDFFYQ